MPNGWGGAEPTQQIDAPSDSYELSARFTTNDNIIVSKVRVWSELSVNVSNRNAYIWSTGGVVQATINIDDTLPGGGWTEYDLPTPLAVASGVTLDVSYGTTQYYGIVANPFPQSSLDGAVTYGSGRYATAPGNFPNNVTTTFYGIDIVYDIDDGVNADPDITAVNVTQADLDVAVSVSIEDEFPSTVTLNFDWGDGTSTSTGPGITSSAHTYTSGGTYAILITATDAEGAKGTTAVAVNLSASLTTTADESWVDDILDAIVSDVQRSGYFEKVNTHEPKKAPRTGLTAAVWVQAINPLALASGLASTSAQLIFTLRLYSNMLKEPQDMIDPEMVRATSNIMRRYHDDFDFEGAIRNVDLLGNFGTPLSALAGYLEIDGKQFRVMDITIPCIVNDVWPQVH